MRWWRTGRSTEDALFEVIERHMLTAPDAWKRGEFHLVCQAKGIDIWIANKAFGLAVSVDGAEMRITGGWKRRLWRAVNAHAALVAVSRFEKELGTNAQPDALFPHREDCGLTVSSR